MQQWLANAAELERWLAEREQFLREDWNSIAVTADGVEGVEQKIRVGRVVGLNFPTKKTQFAIRIHGIFGSFRAFCRKIQPKSYGKSGLRTS